MTFLLIFDETAKTLIQEIQHTNAISKTNQLIKQLIFVLHKNCQNPELQRRYQNYRDTLDEKWDLDSTRTYPIDPDGYAISFDPITQELDFWNTWLTYGFVVGKAVVPHGICQKTVARISTLISDLSDGLVDINKPETFDHLPFDNSGTSCLNRGFFEIYHDNSLAEIRQALGVYLHHVLIWGRVDLWTTFDRFGLKLPDHPGAQGLPLHVDQNPKIHPHFRTIQGVLALDDCPIERGTFVAIPGSKNAFLNYADVVDHKNPSYQGEYIEALTSTSFGQSLQGHGQAIPLRAGNMVSWDSRTTHANSTNQSDKIRYVAYICAGIAHPIGSPAHQHREQAFISGLGSNVRDALMHASMPPRYTDPEKINTVREPEKLTYLGELLYGKKDYEHVA